jgi:hypothetical protein
MGGILQTPELDFDWKIAINAKSAGTDRDSHQYNGFLKDFYVNSSLQMETDE